MSRSIPSPNNGASASEQILRWLKLSPLPALIFGSFVYTYTVEQKATAAADLAAIAAETKRDLVRREEKMDARLDRLLDAILAVQADQKRAETAADEVATDLAARDTKKENK